MNPAPARILLLEDDPADRKFMATCIDGHGHEGIHLKHAARLAEAQSSLEQQDFELVIADLNLPDTDGLDTFFKIREMAPDSAIVVMTGMNDPDLAARAVREGAQDYLIKGDLSPEKVWRSVSNALHRNALVRALSGVARSLRQENASLKDLARIDPLTGLLNRDGVQRALKRLSLQESRAACALLVDVDGFKRINEMLGYAQGDRTLRSVARAIREHLRPGDSAGRIGRDDFLVLLAPATGAQGVALAEKIRLSVAEQSVPSPAGAFQLTVSVGVAVVPSGNASLNELLARTHSGLRLSKGEGKNRVRGIDVLMDGAGPAVIQRPFFKLTDGTVAGNELSPPEWRTFLEPAAAGAVSEHLRRQFQAACTHGSGLECHLRLTHTELFQLRPKDLDDALPASLDRRRLRLSIPEVPMSPLPEGLLDSVRRLQKAGWIFAVHDLKLGTHHWANLILLEPAVVTLHRDLVAGVAEDAGRLRSLVRLHRALDALGAYSIADGVESRDELEILASLGVPFGRGRFWDQTPSRPAVAGLEGAGR